MLINLCNKADKKALERQTDFYQKILIGQYTENKDYWEEAGRKMEQMSGLFSVHKKKDKKFEQIKEQMMRDINHQEILKKDPLVNHTSENGKEEKIDQKKYKANTIHQDEYSIWHIISQRYLKKFFSIFNNSEDESSSSAK